MMGDIDSEYSKSFDEFWSTIAKIKKLIRSELRQEDWSKNKFFGKHVEEEDFPSDIDYFDKPPDLRFFEVNYKKRGIPACIGGIVNDWPAKKNWTFEKLVKRFANSRFKVGEDDDGRSVKMKMKHFITYTRYNQDDSPMTLFDSMFGEQKHIRTLMADYTVPTYFADNWYRYSDYTKQPPSRWFVLGPARSGTNIHIDPMGTSAWNALVAGTKLWVLFPPKTPKSLIKIPSDYPEKELKGEAMGWFRSVFTKCRSDSWPVEYAPIFCKQRAGDVIFVPSGWWHVVLNATDTIAVTENFCDQSNFLKCVNIAKRSRPRFFRHWLSSLMMYRPDIVTQFPEIFFKFEPCPCDSDTSSTTTSNSSSDENYTSGVEDDESEDEVSNISTSSRKRTNSESSGPRSQRAKYD